MRIKFIFTENLLLNADSPLYSINKFWWDTKFPYVCMDMYYLFSAFYQDIVTEVCAEWLYRCLISVPYMGFVIAVTFVKARSQPVVTGFLVSFPAPEREKQKLEIKLGQNSE